MEIPGTPNIGYGESPIAIIGIGCRFPGSAYGPRAFWNLLTKGVDAVAEVPSSRQGFSDLYDPDPHAPGRIYSRWGGFIEGVEEFDAGFFGISPREASRIDPQHRLLLELVWEACEDAGIPPPRLAGTRTGVFIGISTHDYGDMQMYPENREEIDLYSNSGTATSIASNRISYIYDLRGPSMSVDTACSSALTAVHLCCQSLRNGECEQAVAGGVQIVLAPELSIGFCKASMLSRDGRCKAFDNEANGYVRGEGGGIVLLKPLQKAINDGDPIYAVIRSTSINEDGRTQGMTVPSPSAQQSMLEAALDKAGVSPTDIQYVEAHGTGTAVGDPIEAAAIGAALSKGRAAGHRWAIGSVKTNIGHLEAASGIAGLIKVALSLKHKKIPPSLHFYNPNPAIDFEALGLRVVTALESWPEPAKPSLAGVNSFGFGGANAHAILQEAPSSESTSPVESEVPRPTLLVASGRSHDARLAIAQSYSDYLSHGNSSRLRDVCFTAAERRSHHDYRVAVVAKDKDEIAESLAAFAAGDIRLNVSVGKVPATGPGKLAFVFSGMGPQWWGMGQQLYATERVFRESFDRCDAALRKVGGWSLNEEFAKREAARVASPELAQVTNFAIQVALSDLWTSYGVFPDALMGHSGGAMAAAYMAGVYSLEDAIELCHHRSRLQGRPSNYGKMLAVGAAFDDVREYLQGHEESVVLAALNSPSNITLAGDQNTLEKISAALQEKQIFTRMLAVDIAYHSPVMNPIREEFLASVAGLKGQKARIPLVSDTTGARAEGSEFDGEYWWQTIIKPVLFWPAMQELVALGIQNFLEIGPHPVLATYILECLKYEGVSGLLASSIRRKEDEREAMLRSLGSLYCAGYSPNWSAVQPSGDLASLPGYPWQKERHWFEPAGKATNRRISRQAGDHPLLGARTRSAHPAWENLVGTAETSYLQEHVVQSSAVMPAAAYLELAFAARSLLGSSGSVTVRKAEFLRPLVLNGSTSLQFALNADGRHFEVFSSAQASSETWVSHARGLISASKAADLAPLDLAALSAEIANPVDPADFYERMNARGLHYGNAFRGIRQLWNSNRRSLGRVQLEPQQADGYQVHPALLDSAFQLLVSAADTDLTFEADRRIFLPVEIREARLHARPGSECWALAKVTSASGSEVTGDVQLADKDGTVCVEIMGLKARLVEQAGARVAESIDQWLYEYRWEPQARRVTGSPVPLAISVLADAPLDGIADKLRERAATHAIETGWNAYYDHVEEKLNALAAAYAAAAFERLGINLQAGTVFASDSLTPTSDEWRHALANRCCVILSGAGVLRRRGDDWETTGKASPGADTLAADLLVRFPRHRLDVELLARCGSQLAEVIAGKIDGRDFLFTEEGFGFLEEFYRESPASAFYNALVADIVAELTSERTQDRPLFICEVGTGTAGTTSHVLPKVNGAFRYVLSDVSPRFLEEAESKFAEFRTVGSQVFDVAQPSGPQGLQPRSFDLILGANVLHATPQVKESIAHLRELLAPGGVLLLLEITTRPYWLDIAFGSMEGWWSFQDHELRPDHALMDGAGWRSLLHQSGLDSVSLVADTESVEPAQSVLLAREPFAQDRVGANRQNWLIFADRTGVAERLSRALSSFGQTSTLVYAGDRFSEDGRLEICASSAADIDRLFVKLAPQLSETVGIVHLWSLDIPASSDQLSYDSAIDLGCGSVVELLKKVVPSLSERGQFTLITAGAQPTNAADAPSIEQSPLWGLGRVILKELPSLRCRMIDLTLQCDALEIASLAEEILSEDSEEEISLSSAERFVHRLRATSLAQVSNTLEALNLPDPMWRAEVSTAGSLESVVFRQAARRAPEADEIEVAIDAAGLNFRDVVLATNIVAGLESDQTFGKKMLGSDFSGTVTRCGENVTEFNPGDEVFGIAPACFASFATTNARLVARRPAGLSAEAAAAIPVAYLTAWYALCRLARLCAGETVLVHAATGGVGLAAIAIAKLCGATVFATAGSDAKREYLRSLGIEHVMDSRTLSFSHEIQTLTAGRGVDVVLNSLAGEALEAGVAALAPYGRFVELGKADIYQNQLLELGPFRKNLSFFAVDLDRISFERPALISEMLHEISQLIESGELAPLPVTTFPVRELPEALRLMAQAKHIGKVVARNEGPVTVRPAILTEPPILSHATYLVTGGLGGVALSVASWLIDRGARCLALMSRNEPSPEVRATLDQFRTRGARIEVLQGDVSHEQDVTVALQYVASNLPPLRGILHAAMVLDDSALTDLNRDRLHKVMAPKILGAWNLHRQTLDQHLDFFVCFSSITSLMGNPQQGNYAAASAFLDAFSQYRRARALPGTTVNWGVIAGVGYVARHPEIAEFLEKQGYLSFTPDQTVHVLDEVLRRSMGQIMAARIDWKQLHAFSPRVTMSNRIRHLIPSEGKPGSMTDGSMRATLQNTTPAERQEKMEDYLRVQVGRLLGGSRAVLEVDRPISDFGLDSLVAAELTVLLDRDFSVQIDSSQILSGMSIRSLAQLLLQRLLFAAGESADKTGRVSKANSTTTKAAVSTITATPVSAQPAPPSEIPSVEDVDLATPHEPEPDTTAKAQPQAVVSTTSDLNKVNYASLDYTRWSPVQKFVRGLSRGLFRAFADVDVEGLQHIPTAGAFILAINHLSMTEVPLLLNLLSRRAIVLVNSKWRNVHSAHWLISRLGQAIYITPGESREESLRPALAVLNAGGILSLAPEGTRSRTGGLQQGRTGVAYLAVNANVPVVPLAAWGHELWMHELKHARRGRIHVRVGSPLHAPPSPPNATMLRAFTEEVMLALAQLLPLEYRGIYKEIPDADDSQVVTRKAAS